MHVSVIIPTYNRKALLHRAVNSVLNQTYAASEIIIVDDGSTDGTTESIQKLYPQIILINTGNLGVSHARNCGIRAASSEWLAFLDSDDEWINIKLERQAAAISTQPEFKICHSDENWIRHGKHLNQKKKHKKRGGSIFRDCLPLCAISPSAVLIHNSVFDDIGPFDENLPACEDYDLWLRITAKYPVLFVNEPLVTKYGGHDDQLSKKYWGMDRFRIQAIEKIIDHGQLGTQDLLAALRTILEKLEILIQGAKKRDNREVVNCYSIKLKHYRKLYKIRFGEMV